MKKEESIFWLSTTGMICATLVCLCSILSSCNQQQESELTKRQYIAGTNMLSHYRPYVQ